MDISVIIPTYNNAQCLKHFISSIDKLSIPDGVKCELVIVNNASTDYTDDVVKNVKSKIHINYVSEPTLGISRARNKALEAANGKLVISTDDDIELSENWLVAYWKAYLEKPEGHYFGGPVTSRFEDNEIDRELLNFAPYSVKGLDWGESNRYLEEEEIFIGPNFAFPKYFIDQVGPFNISYGLNAKGSRVGIASETELMMRFKAAGFKPYYIAKAGVIQHVPKKKYQKKHIMHRNLAYGYEYARLRKKEIEGPLIYDIPRWVYKDYIVTLFKYWKQRLEGKRAYKIYSRLKYLQGFCYGCKDRKKIKGKSLNEY